MWTKSRVSVLCWKLNMSRIPVVAQLSPTYSLQNDRGRGTLGSSGDDQLAGISSEYS